MFRKKKNLGTVTVFEQDTIKDDFDDLGLNDVKRNNSTDHDLNQMTASQLEALSLGTAQNGREGTQRALRMALEAREIGASTANTMHKQTEQLEKMSEDIEVVHNYLDKSDRIIDKMVKPKFVRMFNRKKLTGKGFDKAKTSKKDIAEREELREKGVDGVDFERMTGTSQSVTLEDLESERDQLLDAENVQNYKRGRRGKKKGSELKNTRQIKEDYSQYSEPVATVMKQQDDDLDQISDALADMNALASAMNNELNYQDKLITDVQDSTKETSIRAKENAKKIKRIK